MSLIKQLAVNDEGFVFNPITGESFTTNETGLFILKMLKEGKTEDQIIQQLVSEFEVSEEEAKRDFIDFVEKLRSYRLL